MVADLGSRWLAGKQIELIFFETMPSSPSLLEIFPRHRLLAARRAALGPQVAANRNRLLIDDVEIDRAELWIARYQYLYALTVLEF
jgi:hypothetical protein